MKRKVCQFYYKASYQICETIFNGSLQEVTTSINDSHNSQKQKALVLTTANRCSLKESWCTREPEIGAAEMWVNLERTGSAGTRKCFGYVTCVGTTTATPSANRRKCRKSIGCARRTCVTRPRHEGSKGSRAVFPPK